MHYILAPNFIGLPALSVPVGAVPSTHAKGAGSSGGGGSGAGAAGGGAGAAPAADAAGSTDTGAQAGGAGKAGSGPLLLPVGLQLMAPCWHEGALLHAGAVLDAALAAAGKAMPMPAVWYDVLSFETTA